eukprot:UN17934
MFIYLKPKQNYVLADGVRRSRRVNARLLQAVSNEELDRLLAPEPNSDGENCRIRK